MILLCCLTVSLLLGIRTNFFKPKWIPINFLLLFFSGILVISLLEIDWKYGFFQEIRLLAEGGFIYSLLPSFLVFGIPFLIGFHGYQIVNKLMKKLKQE